MNPHEHPPTPAIQDADFRRQRSPIFILGIVQRSGTNYLNNLLLKHPDVRSPGIVWEDFYLAPADHLNAYAASLQPSWNTNWTAQLQAALGPDAVLNHLGEGLIHLMESQYRYCVEVGKQAPPSGEPVSLVTATPNTRNLDQFFRLFPEAAPVLIVRDGRAVVESGVRSFNWDYEEAMRMWTSSGQRILDFCQRPEHAERFLLTHYETLYLEPKNEMRRILDFLKLDCGRFDFDVCDTLGVMGSSELKQGEAASLHWKYVEKPKDFNPLARASHWPEAMRQRFLYVAGSTMAALGYALPDADMANRSRWSRWNHAMDWLYTAELKLRRTCPGSAALLKRLRYRMLNAPKTLPGPATQAA